MKKHIVLGFLFLMGGIALAQNRAELVSKYEKLMKKEKYADAVEAIQKVIDSDAQSDDLYIHYINLGISQNNLKNYQPALTAFDVANQLHPNLVYVIKKRGEIRFKLKDYNGTIDDYTRLIENDSKNEDFLFVRSNAFMRLKDTVACLQDLHTILSFNPEYAPAQNNIADIQMARGELQEAMAVFQNLLKKHPDESILNENMGEVNYKMGFNDLAMVYFLKAQKMDPSYSAPYISIGRIQLQTGDYAGALKNFEKAATLENHCDELPALIEQCKQKTAH